jgi:glucose/arabinose dehydrogenase/mono/diheme cytochrome c family protein
MGRGTAAAISLVGMIGCLVSATAKQADRAQPRQSAAAVRAWADWVEPDFPFFSSVLDARRAAAGLAPDNLTPRALVVNVGRGCWAGFDTDLLRIAAIWCGTGVTPKALAPGSYHAPDRKTPAGQSPAPEPDGTVWLVNGIYPGWQSGLQPAFDDPREPAPTPSEVGRGPLPEPMGRFKAIRLVGGGAVLEYTAAGGATVREWMSATEQAGRPIVERHFEVGPATEPLWLVLGSNTKDTSAAVAGGASLVVVDATVPRASDPPSALGAGPDSPRGTARTAPVWAVRLPAHKDTLAFSAAFAQGRAPFTVVPRAIPTQPAARRWTQEVITRVTPARETGAYVVDDVALPLDNPWRRDVRLSDVQFLPDGTGVVITLDGDVWFVRGMHEREGRVRWRRFASGLHEPLTLATRDGQVYAFDRNGVWRLRDTNGDGEADVHELFSNAFAQTADMREFPSSLRLAPGGEFVIAKGGQEATTLGKHNGSVLRISADGRRAEVIGFGFRQPNVGVNARTGLVVATDQQGNYIPSTPLHVVRNRQFYGFLSDKQPREVYPAPIAEPITWIPHEVSASAISPLWLFGARMGPLTDELVYIGFNRPELFHVLLNTRTEKLQASVVSVTRAFDFPPLNGSVNPADGQLYVAGFQIFGWGTTATRLAGLGRVRFTGAASTLPREIVAMDKGVLLKFDVALDAATAVDPDRYSLASWHYKRTYQYGSPQFKADGTPGTDPLVASRVYLSKDGRSVFVGVPGMRPVMQMRVGWSLATAAGTAFTESAAFTPYELPAFDSRAEGFGELSVDLSPRTSVGKASVPVSAEEGARLYRLYGCSACHSIDGSSTSTVGPTWKGLYGRSRPLANRPAPLIADDAYLRESILDPGAKIASGYERAESRMSSYAGVLTDSQIDSIILFIKSLK